MAAEPWSAEAAEEERQETLRRLAALEERVKELERRLDERESYESEMNERNG